MRRFRSLGRTVALLVFCLLNTATAGVAKDREEEEAAGARAIIAQVQAVLDAQRDAWNRGDVDGYMNGYAPGDETEFISGDTLTRGWQTVHDRYKAKYDTREKMGTLTFSEIEIEPLRSDAAFVTGRWSIARNGDNPHGRFTLLVRRLRNEGWRIVRDHTSAAEK